LWTERRSLISEPFQFPEILEKRSWFANKINCIDIFGESPKKHSHDKINSHRFKKVISGVF
jgi:hypothetical protein